MNNEIIPCPNCGLLILSAEDYCLFCEDVDSDSTELSQMYEDQYDLAGSRCGEDGELIPEEAYTAEDEVTVWGERNCDFEFIYDDI